MNILFICDEYPPGMNGGIGSITQVLGRTLVKQGHKVFVVGLYSYEYGSADYEEDNGVKVWRLRYGFRLPRIKKVYGMQKKLPGILKRILYANRDFRHFTSFIRDLISFEAIDIVEQPDWLTYGYEIGIDNPVLPSLSIPLVLKFHGSHTYSCNQLSIAPKEHYSKVDHFIYQRADAMVAVSKNTANINKAIFGGKLPISVLYNSIEVPDVIPNHKRSINTVFYAGSLVKTKGVYSLMHAWNIVGKQFPELQLILFGKGKTQPLVDIILPELRNSVLFKGHQPRQTLLSALENVSFAIYPSYTEAFSLAPLESMARACATIFTSRSSGKELITDGLTGLLVDPDNIEEMAQKIILLVQNSSLRNELGNAGRKRIIDFFEINKSADDHIAYYKSVIKDWKSV